MKTYVITLSQVFPTWHKRAGEPTKFRAAFLSGQTCSKCKKRNHAMCTSECFSGLKIHTIRANYPLWLKRITEVQQGKASSNQSYPVEKLFTVDGITVYRFSDNDRYVYFTNRTGDVQYSYQKRVGKATKTIRVQTVCNDEQEFKNQ